MENGGEWGPYVTEVPIVKKNKKKQYTDLLCKSMDWFLYNKDFRYERVVWKYEEQIKFEFLITSSGVVMVLNFTADAQVFMKLKIFYLLSPTLVFMCTSATQEKQCSKSFGRIFFDGFDLIL